MGDNSNGKRRKSDQVPCGVYLKSPATIEAFPLANKPLYDGIPEVIKIDTTATLIASMRLSTYQLFEGPSLLNRRLFAFKYL